MNTSKPTNENAAVQQLFRRDDADFHDAIFGKLKGIWETKQLVSFGKCGHDVILRGCKCCKVVEELAYRCNLKWCPLCNWRLAELRRQFLTEYASTMKNPIHVVLTQKSVKILTATRIREKQINMAKLRRQEVFAAVTGGCASIEITWNREGDVRNGVKLAGGFHIHSHWLVDASYISEQRMKNAWAKLVEQDFSIGMVKPIEEEDFLQEICKYVVEGSEIAAWPAEIIRQFVMAIKGKNCFFTFGDLRKRAREFRGEAYRKNHREAVCECGESDFCYRSQPQCPADERPIRTASDEQRQLRIAAEEDAKWGRFNKFMDTAEKEGSQSNHFRIQGELACK